MMEKNELITVVVPIYNVENYIGRCVSSIISQTYHNIEILLVNDGSTDKSEEICNSFSDDRIRILTKKNGGLSDARNYGIEHAKGNYILFIDGDDFVHKEMIETLYKNLLRAEADISVCSFCYYLEDAGCKEYYKHEDDNILEIFDSKHAILKMMDKDIALKQCAWNKLYKISLFEDVRYPYGRLYEDMGTTYKTFLKSKKIVYTHKNLYYYVQRKGSITKTLDFNKKELDRIEMANDFYNETVKEYPELKYDLLGFIILQYLAVINVAILSHMKANKIVKDAKKIIRGRAWRILKRRNSREKKQILMFYFSFPIYKSIYKKVIKG